MKYSTLVVASRNKIRIVITGSVYLGRYLHHIPKIKMIINTAMPDLEKVSKIARNATIVAINAKFPLTLGMTSAYSKAIAAPATFG
jgi:hypothetical protein